MLLMVNRLAPKGTPLALSLKSATQGTTIRNSIADLKKIIMATTTISDKKQDVQADFLPLLGTDYVEFYVGNAKNRYPR